MTIPYTDDDVYGQSYPPSLWMGQPEISGAVPGQPGYFTDQYGNEYPPAPTTIDGLIMLVPMTGEPAWTVPGDYVMLGDESTAWWDGEQWQPGTVPAAADPVPDASWTIAQLDEYAARQDPPVVFPSGATKATRLAILQDPATGGE